VTLEATRYPTSSCRYQSSRKELLIRAATGRSLTVPLLREDRVIGALSVTRKTPGPFAPEDRGAAEDLSRASRRWRSRTRACPRDRGKGKELEIASRHKSDFLANMSTNCRTPLNDDHRLFGGAHRAHVRRADEKKQADYMKDIHESGRHLLSLINDILDLSRSRQGAWISTSPAFDLPRRSPRHDAGARAGAAQAASRSSGGRPDDRRIPADERR